MSDAESLWRDRFDEDTVRLEPEVTPERCVQRYDVDDRETLEDLTNAALEAAFDADCGSVALEDLDATAEDLGVFA